MAKIYAIYKNEIVSAEVIEKPKTFRMKKDTRQFGYRSVFSKDEVDLTPEAACERFKSLKEGRIEWLNEKLAMEKKDLEMINGLIEGLKK